jgi:hypothetical protein
MPDAMRRLRIPIGQVLPSPTCRSLETVRLAQLWSPKTYSKPGNSGQSMMTDKSGQLDSLYAGYTNPRQK